MKKRICIAAAFALLLSLTACTRDEPLPTETGAPTETAVTEATTEAPTEEATQVTSEPSEELKGTVIGKGSTLYRNDLGAVWLSAWVTVQNDAAVPISLPAMDLTATMNDGSTKLLAGVTAYPNILAAGEIGCYYEETRVDTDQTGAAELTFTLAPQPASEDAVQRYTVSEQTQLRDSVYGGLTLIGEVKNDTKQDSEGMICVAAVLYGEDGNVLSVLYTYLSDVLPAGESVGFTLDSFMLPADITADTVTRTEIFAYPA